MSSRNKWQITAVAGAFFLLVLLILAPRVPDIDKEAQLQAKVDEAAQLVQSSPRPMEGIMMLREVLEEDPDNKDALWYLGGFSMQSGQYEKAVERFHHLERLLDENDTPQVKTGIYVSLSEAYLNLGDNEKALSYLEKIKKEVDDPKLIPEIDRRIKEIENINNN